MVKMGHLAVVVCVAGSSHSASRSLAHWTEFFFIHSLDCATENRNDFGFNGFFFKKQQQQPTDQSKTPSKRNP